MGGLISRLRAKPSTKELLEEVEKEIQVLEEYKRSTEAQHKRIVGSLFFYFILLFIGIAGFILVYYFPSLTTTKEKLIYSTPLWLVPVLCIVLKKFFHFYFMQKLKYNDENLKELKRKRRSLIEFAMETETYKVVKDLLQKYDPEYHRKFFETPAIAALPTSSPDSDLRRRVSPSKSTFPTVSPGQTITLNTGAGPSFLQPIYMRTPINPPISVPPLQPPQTNQAPPILVRPQLPQLTRPVLPRERTLVDRLVDYMVGDGPSNRYALICRQCASHNGMALREDFENIAFRCCYCFHWNPPKNQQTGEPKSSQLAIQAPSPVVSEPPSSPNYSSSESDSSRTSGSPGAEDTDDKVEETFSFRMMDCISGSDSPTTVRKRLNLSMESEIQAVLEEDKCNNLHAELD